LMMKTYFSALMKPRKSQPIDAKIHILSPLFLQVNDHCEPVCSFDCNHGSCAEPEVNKHSIFDEIL